MSWAVQRIIESEGAVRIGELEEKTGLSRYGLMRGFRQQTGVTPKRFVRIRRFRNVLHLLKDSELEPSQIALVTGYYDQAHMSNEFKRMSGLTPCEFRRALDRYQVPFRLIEVSSDGPIALQGTKN